MVCYAGATRTNRLWRNASLQLADPCLSHFLEHPPSACPRPMIYAGTTHGQDRIQNDSKSTDWRTLCRPRSLGMQVGLQNLSTGWPQLDQNRVQWRQFVKTVKIRLQRNCVQVTVWQLQPPRGSKRTQRAVGMVVALSGDDEWWLRISSNGVGWLRMVATTCFKWGRVATNGMGGHKRALTWKSLRCRGCVVSAQRSFVCFV